MADLLKAHNVRQHIMSGQLKASYAENYVKILKVCRKLIKLEGGTKKYFQTKIYRYLEQNNTKRYVDDLPALVASINHRYLDSIGMSPDQVTVENSLEVFRRKYHDVLYMSRPKEALRYKIGDYVRIPILKKTFDKSYLQNYMDEVFIVKKIVYRPPVYVYKLMDNDGKPLNKDYYAEELVRVFHPSVAK